MRRCFWTRSLVYVAAGAILYAGASPVFAQRRYPYTPSRPTISPYFNYFRNDTGGIPAYYQFVRPRVEMRRFASQVDAELRQQDAVLQQQADTIGLFQQQLQNRPLLEQRLPQSAVGSRPLPAAGFMTHGASFGQFQSSRSGLNRSRATSATGGLSRSSRMSGY